jgi:hypothetical protein
MLTIELVPKTSWFVNVRSKVSQSEWGAIRHKCYSRAGWRCEICGGTGNSHPVECHEIFEYDDVNHIQKLVGLIALCPKCHMVKHIGLANVNGKLDEAIKHIEAVNGCGRDEAVGMVDDAMSVYRDRSAHKWHVDLSYLDVYKDLS